eukprot:2406677-Pleurochrysis_carterae.AAC.1
MRLFESPGNKPREERTLPSAPGLSHTVEDDNIRLRPVRVRPVGKLPRSPSDAWRGPAGRPATRVCGVTWHASWHRTSARSRCRESVHNLGRITSL